MAGDFCVRSLLWCLVLHEGEIGPESCNGFVRKCADVVRHTWVSDFGGFLSGELRLVMGRFSGQCMKSSYYYQYDYWEVSLMLLDMTVPSRRLEPDIYGRMFKDQSTKKKIIPDQSMRNRKEGSEKHWHSYERLALH